MAVAHVGRFSHIFCPTKYTHSMACSVYAVYETQLEANSSTGWLL